MASKALPLFDTHPLVAARWLGNVNADPRTPDEFSVKARLRCIWWCGDPRHEVFEDTPGAHHRGFSCPHCFADRRRAYAATMNLPVASVPALVAAWRDERPYDGLTVRDLATGVAGKNFGLTYSLRCQSGHKIDTVVSRFVSEGCPWCRGKQTRARERPPLAIADPELAALFHSERNAPLTPDSTPDNYRGPLWWKAQHCCGHEWEETISDRVLGRRPQAGRGRYYCPRCESVWGSLAWIDPELASEWHPSNALTPWHVKPFSVGTTATWQCANGHVWDAPVINRSAGAQCPKCSMAGTSHIEQEFLAAARVIDPEAHPARIGKWRVDVFLPAASLVIEYDGSYWHRNKFDTDLRKTIELVDAGLKVVRIRENGLPHLELTDPRTRQVSYWPSSSTTPSRVVAEAVAWAADATTA